MAHEQVAIQTSDGFCHAMSCLPPAMAKRLEAALTEASVHHLSEIYSGAAHGWMMPDFPVYDQVSAERGWQSMLALFDRNSHK